MLKKWLNAIIHLTNIIYRGKKKLQYSNIFLSVFWGTYIIVSEILLAVISLPLYIFIKPGRTSKVFADQDCPGKDLVVLRYCIRRRLTFLSLMIFVIVVILKIIAFFIIGSASITELSEAFMK